MQTLITGADGFIGSHLLEHLLRHDQRVIGLDNFSTGYQHNLDEVRSCVGGQKWSNFSFVEGDIQNVKTCRAACEGVDYVLHHAALGSVPLSIEDPIRANADNVTGFLNMLVAARDAGVKRFVYAASSATYGDDPRQPKREQDIGAPLSPYAVTKYVNELYAQVFYRCYGLQTIGLRYFNIFGPRQDPNGAYAAVIPRWISTLLDGKPAVIHGDGLTTRDFCFVDNVVQANLLAAHTENQDTYGQVFNIASGQKTTLNELHALIRAKVELSGLHVRHIQPEHADFRLGDVRHSHADIARARTLLGYDPSCSVEDGLAQTVSWHVARHQMLTGC